MVPHPLVHRLFREGLRPTGLVLTLTFLTACGKYQLVIEEVNATTPAPQAVPSGDRTRPPNPLFTQTTLGLSPTTEPLSTADSMTPYLTTPTSIPENVVTPNIEPQNPHSNSLYFGTVGGESAVFVSTEDIKERSGSNDMGLVVYADGTHRSPFNFEDLDSPKLVLAPEREIVDVMNFAQDPSQDSLWVSMILLETPDDRVGNHLYGVDFNSMETRELWVHDIGSDRYGSSTGAALIDQATAGHFVVLKILPCYACEPSDARGVLILNSESRNEKYLDLAGDLRLDLEKNTVSYKRLGVVQEPCEPSPGCGADGYRDVYQPTGETLTEGLP